MDKYNKDIDNPNKDNLDSTKKFDISDITWKVDGGSTKNKAEDSSDETSTFFKRASDLSNSPEKEEAHKDIFEEIFDSQKKATDSFDDTFIDLPAFSDTIDSRPESEDTGDTSSETIFSKDIPTSEGTKLSDESGNTGNTDTFPSGKKSPAKKDKRKKKSFFKSNTWFVIRTLLLVFLFTTLICAIALINYMRSLDATVDLEFESLRQSRTSVIYYIDENGEPCEYENLYATQNRTWVNIEDMPEHLKNAAIAIEDHRFREHNGVDWKRTLGASYNLFFKTQGSFGASTITQQLVKNLTGDNQDSVKRKLQEIMRAQYLEDKYSKDEILEFYLNTIFLGEGCYGVGSAAHTYFGKDASELTIAESAAIIGITNLPTYYNPYINPENNQKRCHTIINRMHELEMISDREREDALNEVLVFKTGKTKNKAPDEVQSYFVDQIIEQLLVDLTEKCGYSRSVALHKIYTGGLKIYATIKPEIQNSMDEVFLRESKDSKDATFTKLSGNIEQPQCAMVLIDPQNGNVVAMRGGRGEKTGARVLNRATQTKRPPGSTIKPISVYAPAMHYEIITPFSPEDDAPIIFFKNENEKENSGISRQDNVSAAVNPGQAGKCYPNNESRKFSGRTNILEGVKESLNTISMRTLNKLGFDRSFTFLSAHLRLGTLSPSSDKDFAPLALGQLTDGATVLEMAAAYVPFANGGTYYEPKFYTKVLDYNGNVLIDNEETAPIEAMSKKAATYMNYTLRQVVESGTGKKAKLSSGIPVGGKTGTSSKNRDFWFIGYTPYYVGATWFGYDNNAELGEASRQAIKPWKAVMDAVHDNLPYKDFEVNEDFVSVEICSKSALLPCEHCYKDPRGSQVITGYFHKDDVPKKKCDIHQKIVIDKTTNMPASKYCPLENRQERVYMLLNRYHNVSGGVVLADEAYVANSGELPKGMFRYSDKNGSRAITEDKTCSVHNSSVTLPDSEDPDEADSHSTSSPSETLPDNFHEDSPTPETEDSSDDTENTSENTEGSDAPDESTEIQS